MRKQVLACLLLGALGAQAQEKFVVEGQLKHIPDGTVFSLMKREGNVGSMAATDTLRNGTFRFELTTAGNGLERYDLMAHDRTSFPPMSLSLWVNPGSRLLVQGENSYIYSWTVESDVKEQQFQQQLMQASRKEWEEFQRLTMQEFELMRSAAQGGNKEQARAKADSLQQLTEKLSDQITQHNIALMKQSPVNAVWMDELYRMGMSVKFRKGYPYKEDVQQLYNRLDAAQKETSEGKSVYLALNPPTVVKAGEEAVDADMYDLEGKVHHLAEFRGKYVLLDFWSRGCGPCIMSQPELKEISERYKDSLEVVSLSIENRKGWEEASKAHAMTWNNWNDLEETNGLYARYGVIGIPHFVLISPEGKVIDSWSGYGKGLLKLKVEGMLAPKQPMRIEWKDGHKLVHHPRKKTEKVDVLTIRQVELTDSATVLRVHARYIPNYWIRLDKATFLISDKGVNYPLLRSEGFAIDEQVFMPDSGEMDFTLYFAPLPKDTRWFDFSEGEHVEGGYYIEGIRLTE
ncbi:TlpA family protein disulfide reductase [Phocaeicola fibrisolvens]|uniref:TlpA family protein disulfide reductase n=1 Tax=Phocaeicola fibrisolvens TaxID=2981793 RepID=UPI0008228D5C|nr:TlpA disulfide reductase family protein [Phocaeicola fibrisolvens]MCU6777098.1 TlpA family protein disulfide reductase [Phocaeicola fibrisolvens]SCH14666.1 Cytochrome c biogenesis protein tlpA [uncultured Bacteroides sp.]